MYFDGYLCDMKNLFEINNFINQYKDEIEEIIFEEKLNDMSKILYSILLNIKKGMSIEESYKKSDVLSEKYLEHYKDLELLFLIEYEVDNRHKDCDEKIYFIPVEYNNEQLLLCLLGIERDSVFEYKRENKLTKIKEEMSKSMKEFFYNDYTSDLPENISEEEWNYRKMIWTLATEDNDYIKHSFQYPFRNKNINQFQSSKIVNKLNEKMKLYEQLKYIFDGISIEIEIDKKMKLVELDEETVAKRKKDNNYNEKLYDIKIDEQMLKWTFNEYYNYFKSHL